MPVPYHPAWDRRILVGFRDRGLVALREGDDGTWTVPGLTELGHRVLRRWPFDGGTGV
ncbi:hypothetical protein [Embleya scabrispora]|uniref:hypothetical protein n=1 Tax=Embleya scabrispora TaxID=159449 RepID=UPI001374ADB5|nr:hypothetical protein [Embleya scabrispora]